MKSFRPRPLLRTWLLVGTTIFLLISELLAVSQGSGQLERIEFSIRDSLMRLRGKQPISDQIAIVAIDDYSFNWNGYQWPWPRHYLAQIVDRLNQAGARLIGMDVQLFEQGYDEGGDAALASALSRASLSTSVIQIFKDDAQPQVTTTTLKVPLTAYYQNVFTGVGLSGLKLDDDAIVRRIQPFDYYSGQVYYHWAFQTASLFLGVDAPTLTSSGLFFNGKKVPLSQGQMLVNYAGPAKITYPTYHASDVADGLVDPSAFRGKIVLIGATSITLKDVYPTPFSAAGPMPGVEIVANAINTLMSGKYLRVTPLWVNLLIIVSMALAAWLLRKLQRPALTIVLMVGLMLTYLGAAYGVFVGARLYLPVTNPELMLFLGVLLPSIEQAVSQEIERRRVRNLFTRFISPEMVDQMLVTRDINSLNKRADITILFSDIRGFTSLSERLTPEQLVALLNPYLEVMTDVVHKNGGTIDKYEGDAIVAFFGEPVLYPDHAKRAVRAACEMRQALVQLQQLWKAEGHPMEHFDIGIGINTGEVFVGLLGSEQRLNYTVIGDNVNLASRLQDQTKIVGWPILVSERTALLVQDEFDVSFAALQAIRGKSEPVKIYKVLGCKDAPEAERVHTAEK